MNIIKVDDNGFEKEAVAFKSLPSGDDLKALLEVLMGKSEYSRLLEPVKKGSVPDTMGAKFTLYLALKEAPEGGFGKGGIYGIMNWVVDVLDKEMPNGMGAALTQPAMFSKKECETGMWWYIVIVSPMDRLKTKAIANFLSDPHNDEAPPLIEVSVR